MDLDFKQLAVLAGVFKGAYVILDSFILHTVLEGHFFLYTILGSWLGVAMVLFYGFFMGESLDPDFEGIGNFTRSMLKYGVLAGLFGSAYTLLYLHLSNVYNPSLVSAVLPLTLVYLLLRDKLFEKSGISFLEAVNILVIFVGALLLSYSSQGFNPEIILLAGILLPLGNAVYVHFMREGMSRGADSINFRLIAALILAVSMTAYSLPRASFNLSAVTAGLPLATLSMTFVFLSFISYLRALKDGKSSLITSLRFSHVAVTFIFTLGFSVVAPSIFGVEATASVWILKILGAALIVTGVTSILLTDDYVFLLIETESGRAEKVAEELSKMPDISEISLTFGSHDIVAKIDTRLTSKFQKTLMTEIEPIEGIENIKRVMASER
ncbi:MAG: Lrp/AsnC ligand binding domain-containing protein [Candidatus Nanohaloarchaea archaeon]